MSLKVLHLSGGQLTGGAALGALSLHEALRGKGVESKYFYSQGTNVSGRKGVYPFIKNPIIWHLSRKIVPRIESALVRFVSGERGAPFSCGLVGYPWVTFKEALSDCDVLHLHWVSSGFLSLRSIRAVKKPIVWTMRDEWPFTGGCHYTWDCDGYQESCGKCPVLNSNKENDLSHRGILRKKKLQAKRISYVGISESLCEKARRSSLLKSETISCIPNCIDKVFFSDEQCDTLLLRHKYGLNGNDIIVVAGAVNLDSAYKGYGALLKLEPVPGVSLKLVTFGSISEETKRRLKIPAIHFGRTSSMSELREIYGLGDMFFAPSKQEAFGKTLAEAGACGLPVVCYDAGGPSEIVLQGENGLKAKPFDEGEILSLLREVIVNSKLRSSLASMSRGLSRRFHPSVAAEQYFEVYRNLLEPKQEP